MRHFIFWLLILGAAVLSACGGGQHGTRPPTVADYFSTVQVIHIAYLGRPADATSLELHAGLLQQGGVAADLKGLLHTQGESPGVRAVLSALSTSAEGQAMQEAAPGTFVSAVHMHLFSRLPDEASAAYWRTRIESGAISRPFAALAIAASAQAGDARALMRKGEFALAFTAALNTDAKKSAYTGVSAIVQVRTAMATVGQQFDPAALPGFVASTIAQLLATAPANRFADARSVIRQRCLGCHSVTPTFPGFFTSPLGIRYDTDEQINADARRIYVNVVITQFMPYGNRTNITAAERDLINSWYISN